eukprot:jgi/Mesvir1/1486/Mv14469-RA.1
MSLSNAVVSGSQLKLTQGVAASGTASYVSPFPKSTDSYEVTFNVTFGGVPGVATKKLFSYGPLIGKWNTSGSVTVDNGSGVTSTSSTTPIATAAATTKKYKITARRVYYSTASLSTFELFVEGVRCISTAGDGTTTEPDLWKLDSYTTPSAGNYAATDSVSALNLAYLTTSAPVVETWLGDWQLAGTSTYLSNTGTGTSGAFNLSTAAVTIGNSSLQSPATGTSVANVLNVTLADLDLTSSGQAFWTVETKLKVPSGNSTQALVMKLGQDFPSSGGGNQVGMYLGGATLVLMTENTSGGGDSQMLIPASYLTTFGITVNDGNYHTFRLARISTGTAGGNITAGTENNAYNIWVDGTKLTINSGSNGITLSNGKALTYTPITSGMNVLRLAQSRRPDCLAAATYDYTRFKNGITTGSDVWLGEWHFDGTSLSNTGTGASTFGLNVVNSGVSTDFPLSGEFQIPTAGAAAANAISVYAGDMDMMGTVADDGYGDWTVDARVRTEAAGSATKFSIFSIGNDSTTGNRIGVYCTGTNLYIATETAAVGSERALTIPFTNLASYAASTAPNDGNYHTYRLGRIQNNTVGTSADATTLHRFWYDGVEFILTVGVNGVAQPTGSLANPPIKSTNAYIRLGNNLEPGSLQATRVDYVRYRNGSAPPIAPISVPNHVSGYFQTYYGTAGYLTSTYWVTGITRGSAANGSGVMVTGIVKPIATLANATGGSIGAGTGTAMTAPFLCGIGGSTKSNKDMVELLNVGDPATPGAYVSVWAWRSGRILMFNGTSYTETMSQVVGASEFVLGVHLTANEPQLYINGQLKSSSDAAVMLPWRTISGNAATTISAVNTGAILSSTAGARGIYLGPRTTYDAASAGTINVAYKNWRVVDTALNSMTAQQIADTQLYRYSTEYDASPLVVTYGFRIADDETLQIVKTQGSMASSTDTMLGNVLPVSEDGVGALTVNALGSIGSANVDPVLDLTNKR